MGIRINRIDLETIHDAGRENHNFYIACVSEPKHVLIGMTGLAAGEDPTGILDNFFASAHIRNDVPGHRGARYGQFGVIEIVKSIGKPAFLFMGALHQMHNRVVGFALHYMYLVQDDDDNTWSGEDYIVNRQGYLAMHNCEEPHGEDLSICPNTCVECFDLEAGRINRPRFEGDRADNQMVELRTQVPVRVRGA